MSRHLAYFRPHGAGGGPVTYLLISLPMPRRCSVETITEVGAAGRLHVHPAQVLPVSGGSLHRVLMASIPNLPADVAAPATLDWCKLTRRGLVGVAP